jgi:hypothetical protein
MRQARMREAEMGTVNMRIAISWLPGNYLARNGQCRAYSGRYGTCSNWVLKCKTGILDSTSQRHHRSEASSPK